MSVCAEPVCAVGQGVSALCCATEGQQWIFSGYSLTGVSPQSQRVENIPKCVRVYLITASVIVLKAVCV